MEGKSARQALTRTAAEGFLTSTRRGRRVLWSLTPLGRTLLEQGADRIYSFLRSGRPWDGRWLVLSVSISESRRKLRHQLRTKLTWLGLGSPRKAFRSDTGKGHMQSMPGPQGMPRLRFVRARDQRHLGRQVDGPAACLLPGSIVVSGGAACYWMMHTLRERRRCLAHMYVSLRMSPRPSVSTCGQTRASSLLPNRCPEKMRCANTLIRVI